MDNSPRPYLLIMGIVAGSCAPKTDLGLLEKVSNRSTIDRAVREWSISVDSSNQRAHALQSILDCAKDQALNSESRAYCVQALDRMAGKSDEAMEEINGMILPQQVVELAKIFSQIERTPAR